MSATHQNFKSIRKEGGTRVVAVGKLLPLRWKIVRLTVVDKEKDKSVTIKYERIA